MFCYSAASFTCLKTIINTYTISPLSKLNTVIQFFLVNRSQTYDHLLWSLLDFLLLICKCLKCVTLLSNPENNLIDQKDQFLVLASYTLVYIS